MIPDNVLNAVYDQMRPFVIELARYNVASESITINFEVAKMTIEFK